MVWTILAISIFGPFGLSGSFYVLGRIGLPAEQHKMLSQLAAQIMPFFRLMARNLTFRDKKYRILTFRDKTELYLAVLQQNNIEACLRCEASFSGSLSGSFWLSLALSLALSGSLWISRACFLALFGSLLLSQALYCSPNLLTKSSLGSQGHCSARSSAGALHDFLLVWFLQRGS